MSKIIKGMPNQEYHSSAGESASNIVAAGESLLNYFYKKTNQSEPTPAMRFGTLVHSAILEPNLFEKEYCVAPVKEEGALDTVEDLKKRCAELELKQTGKKDDLILRIKEKDPSARFWSEIVAEMTNGKGIVSQSDFDEIRKMRDVALAHPCSDYLTQGESEVSIFHQDEETGLILKCRPDKLMANAGLCVNLKTDRDPSARGFISATKNHQYDWSSAFYVDLLAKVYGHDFDEVHFVIQNSAPYHVGIYSYATESLDYARTMYREVLRKIARAKETNEYPGFSPDLQVITLPDYAQKQIEVSIYE